jgi:acetyl-CoA/propionyl-CoA carboxylase biotin carboxyl carrier protein
MLALPRTTMALMAPRLAARDRLPDQGAQLRRLGRARVREVDLVVVPGLDQPVLRQVPAVQAGDLDTGLIDRMPTFVGPVPSADALRMAASAVRLAGDRGGAGAATPAEPGSPATRTVGDLWRSATGWRMGAPSGLDVRLDDGSTVHTVTIDAGTAFDRRGVEIDTDGAVWVHADGATHRLSALGRREALEQRLAARDTLAGAADPELRAPMPGAVVAVHVTDGARVSTGDRIATIEAMKMEHPVTAPHDGVVRVDVAVGDQVRRDQVLAHVTPDPSPSSGTE